MKTIVYSLLLFYISIMQSHADTIILGDHFGESYSGQIVSATQDKVIFDIECSGSHRDFSWATQIFAIHFNGTCIPPDAIGAGGFDIPCAPRPRFMFLDSEYELEIFIEKFSYEGGILKLFPNASLDFNDGNWLTNDGKTPFNEGKYYIKSSDIKGELPSRVYLTPQDFSATIMRLDDEFGCNETD